MFPVQNGLYGHRSTMNQFAKPGYPFLNFDPYPFTNSNLNEFNMTSKSPQYPSSSDELFDYDMPKEDPNSHLAAKKPLSKEERRAEHNAIERARRENLNHKFQSLAQALPNLSNYRRPSKSQIVEKALDWVKQGIAREERYRYQILQLQRENKRLLAQLIQNENGGLKQMMTPSNSTLTNTSTTSLNTMYNDFPDNAGWSCNLMVPTPQMTPSSSTEDLSITKPVDFINPPIIPKIDEDDNSSSVHEDDADYHHFSTKAYHTNSPNKQFEQSFPQSNPNSFMSDLYPVGFQSQDTHFEPTAMNNWSYTKYPPQAVHGDAMETSLSKKRKSIHSVS